MRRAMRGQSQIPSQSAILEMNGVQPNELKSDPEDYWQSVGGRKVRLILAYFFWILTMPISIFLSFEVVPANARAVIWRFGRILSPVGYGPGLLFRNPFCDKVKIMDLREQVAIVPNQKYATKDAIIIDASFVMRIKLSKPQQAMCTTMNQISLAQAIAVDHLRFQFRANCLERFWKSRTVILDALKRNVNQELALFGLRVTYIELTNFSVPLYLEGPLVKLAIENRRAKVKEAVLESQLTAIEGSPISRYEHVAPPSMEYVKIVGLQNCSKALQRVLSLSTNGKKTGRQNFPSVLCYTVVWLDKINFGFERRWSKNIAQFLKCTSPNSEQSTTELLKKEC